MTHTHTQPLHHLDGSLGLHLQRLLALGRRCNLKDGGGHAHGLCNCTHNVGVADVLALAHGSKAGVCCTTDNSTMCQCIPTSGHPHHARGAFHHALIDTRCTLAHAASNRAPAKALRSGEVAGPEDTQARRDSRGWKGWVGGPTRGTLCFLHKRMVSRNLWVGGGWVVGWATSRSS
jgi:hypothetical protein